MPPLLISKLRIMLLLATSCYPLLSTPAVIAKDLPCADDCIAAFELLWTGGESDEIIRTAINDITDQLGRRGHEDIAVITIQQERYIFVAFKTRCDEKEKKLEALLKETYGFLLPEIEFSIMSGPFVRSEDTIDFDGEYWSRSPCCQSLRPDR